MELRSFEHVELFPGPKLNLIIAPNGAGKSTVLCGLCLSLGGNPKLLGRSERLGDFVRCGQQMGSVEVHILSKLHGSTVVRVLITVDIDVFRSFEHVELFPGPKLNLIIAPNGAGKSTVLCGLCLSLGGNPKLLGRSERLGDFVRCGQQMGSVEVHM
uniref:Structural maintenance of chromosomes protein 5 n=1 Tax=Ascaris lumbricoides TaxID=6252 RepID=A0A0M3IRX8_ASCLU